MEQSFVLFIAFGSLSAPGSTTSKRLLLEFYNGHLNVVSGDSRNSIQGSFMILERDLPLRKDHST